MNIIWKIKKISEKSKIYKKNNRKKRNEHDKKRRKEDFVYKLIYLYRSRFRETVKKFFKLTNSEKIYKNNSCLNYLGCSFGEFKIYMESKFYSNPKTGEMMTWENHGFYGWHIDHIIPVSSFDFTKEQDIEKCFHYSNLQPLWAEENLKKGNKI